MCCCRLRLLGGAARRWPSSSSSPSPWAELGGGRPSWLAGATRSAFSSQPRLAHRALANNFSRSSRFASWFFALVASRFAAGSALPCCHCGGGCFEDGLCFEMDAFGFSCDAPVYQGTYRDICPCTCGGAPEGEPELDWDQPEAEPWLAGHDEWPTSECND